MTGKEKEKEKKPEELDFVNLVLLLGSTANVELGGKSQGGFKKDANLPRARQLINMLSCLETKTQGRLNPQENQVLSQVLGDLQEKYVKAAGLNQPSQFMSSWAASQYGKTAKR